jgi:hypothetical protein
LLLETGLLADGLLADGLLAAGLLAAGLLAAGLLAAGFLDGAALFAPPPLGLLGLCWALIVLITIKDTKHISIVLMVLC